MYCLKCGCETKGSNVFCDECLEDMKTCPVKGDIAILIPERAMPEPEKKQKKQRSIASQVRTLKVLLRIMFLTTLLLVAIVCVLSHFLLQELKTPDLPPSLGTNYSTSESTKAP